MTRQTSRALLLYATSACVMLVYLTLAYVESADAAQHGQSVARAPTLPTIGYSYANAALPQHFFTDTIRSRNQDSVISKDNTPANNPVTDAGAALGRVLFYDTALSSTGTVSCASCHVQANSFADPNQFSIGVAGTTRRNSPGLANARFNDNGRFFLDERAASLEDQVLMPFLDQVEMGLTIEQLNQLVATQPYYAELFTAAFGDDVVTSERISLALAQFVRSMVSANSKYDQGRVQVANANQNFPNFTAQENLGKRLFFNPGNRGPIACAACHSTEAFVSEAPRQRGPSNTANIGLDTASTTDLGLAEVTGNQNHAGRFRVASLRNVAVTAPYFHDGRFATLDDVLNQYNGGIQDHPNLANVLSDNGRPDQYNFSNAEKAAIVAFLNTLTDSTFLSDARFSDPFTATGTEPAPVSTIPEQPVAIQPANPPRDERGNGNGNGGNGGGGRGDRDGRGNGGRGNR